MIWNAALTAMRILTISCRRLLTVILVLGPAGLLCAQKERPVSFDRDIRPLLSDRCYACHGPDSSSREAGLRLDLQDEAHDYAIEPGSPDDSELWLRITSDDASELMPPPDSHKDRFTAEQIALIKRWIEQGATYEKFWAFETPQESSPPKIDNDTWSANPIDQFVLAQLDEAGMSPSEQADSRTLLRRSSFDLTGLPPSPEQVDTWLKMEQELGEEVAWGKWIDQLLDSPSYGEHMARYWLDLVRFADTNGMHKDFYRNHFAYRDWVIRAYNQNLGYDEFLKFQLAGDLYPEPNTEQLIATAFNRLHLIIDRGTALPEESFHKNVVDRVTAVSTAFLGLTMQCAQCHDHKYDPITQKDFYSFYAFFNNVDAEPETPGYPENGLQKPYISLANAEQSARLKEFDEQLAKLDREIELVKEKLAILESSDATDPPGQQGEKSDESSNESPGESEAGKELGEKLREELMARQKQLQASRNGVVQARRAYNRPVPYAMVMKEREEIRPTFLLNRGQYDSRGEPVSRATPGFLPPLRTAAADAETPSRMDLANWMVDPDHPLTARVAVNRTWQQLLGTGLVKTSEDFGAQGDLPSHPELLDYLAVTFVKSDWDTKSLIKQIVMSKTYRQSSRISTEQSQRDPHNRLLARGSRFRMDAEMIRDQVLFSSGLLSQKMYGPSVKPPQPDGLWKAVTMIDERYQPDTGEDIYRRSIYTYWKRGMPPPQMTILNAPIRDSCIARRERTNTPSQALLLLNEPEYMKAARTLARRTLQQDSEARIRFAWERVTGKVPDEVEQQKINELIDQLDAMYRQQPELARQACEGLQLSSDDEVRSLAVWSVVINTLYNLDITKNRD